MKDDHDRNQKIISAYIAFVITIFIAVAFKSQEFSNATWIIGLAAFSLPSLVAYLFLDYIIRVKQGRKTSAARGLAIALGFIPSLMAIILTIATFSVLAAVGFAAVTVFWVLFIDIVVYKGSKSKESKL